MPRRTPRRSRQSQRVRQQQRRRQRKADRLTKKRAQIQLKAARKMDQLARDLKSGRVTPMDADAISRQIKVDQIKEETAAVKQAASQDTI